MPSCIFYHLHLRCSGASEIVLNVAIVWRQVVDKVVPKLIFFQQLHWSCQHWSTSFILCNTNLIRETVVYRCTPFPRCGRLHEDLAWLVHIKVCRQGRRELLVELACYSPLCQPCRLTGSEEMLLPGFPFRLTRQVSRILRTPDVILSNLCSAVPA